MMTTPRFYRPALPRVLLGLALGAVASPRPASAASASPPTKPNIIFILADDLGYGDVGVFWQNARKAAADPRAPSHATPQLDRMAQEGVQLRQHYCPAPVCAPSRASLLLGVNQGHANIRDNQFDKALENNHTLATVLKQAGYSTAAIGKYGLQGPGHNPVGVAGLSHEARLRLLFRLCAPRGRPRALSQRRPLSRDQGML